MSRARAESSDLLRRLSEAESERDAARTRALEAEIAGHEKGEALAGEEERRARGDADAAARIRALEDRFVRLEKGAGGIEAFRFYDF